MKVIHHSADHVP